MLGVISSHLEGLAEAGARPGGGAEGGREAEGGRGAIKHLRGKRRRLERFLQGSRVRAGREGRERRAGRDWERREGRDWEGRDWERETYFRLPQNSGDSIT